MQNMRRARVVLQSGSYSDYELCSGPDCKPTPENLVATFRRHVFTARHILDQSEHTPIAYDNFRDYASNPPVGLLCVLGPPGDALRIDHG